MEIWKDIYFEEDGIIYDYKGLYQVSNTGRIKSLNYYGKKGNEKILKGGKTKKYLQIHLYKNKEEKVFYVHRLVAHMFIPNHNNYPCINHKDENTFNNNVENLEWCTHEYNNNYGNHNKNIGESMKGTNHPRLGSLIERWSLNGKLIDIKYQFEYIELGFNYQNISRCCKWYECGEDKEEWFKKYKNYPSKTVQGYIFKYHEGDKNESK